MTTTIDCRPKAASPDFEAIKARQQLAWSSGDYARIGTTLQIVGEQLAEAMDLRAGQKVLDVAAGNGNFTLAAAHRWCEVTSTDYVAELLARGRRRAEAEGFDLTFRQADVEALPFADASFDAVGSTFGCMFSPDQQRVAHEMLRVCRPGGRIGLANWTPDGFIGQMFKTIGKYLPPAVGLKSPTLWGTSEWLEATFRADASALAIASRQFVFRYRSAAHFADTFRRYYGPMLKTFEALEAPARAALTRDIAGLIEAFNISGDETMVVPGAYLEVVVTKR